MDNTKKQPPQTINQAAAVAAPVKTLKVVELAPGAQFDANGKVYTVSESYSIGRFQRVEELEHELMQFSDMRTCHAVMVDAMKKINEMNPGHAWMLLYNKIDSDQRSSKIYHYSLRLVTAYINYEGEDIRYLNEDTIKTKISDWTAEGLDVRPFLVFAVSVFRALTDRYAKPIQSILMEVTAIAESIQKATDIRTLIDNPVNGMVKPVN